MSFGRVGKGTTFYSWLDVPPSASTAEIGRAYRKKSMLLQCISYLSFFVLIFLRARHLHKVLIRTWELKAPRNDLRVSVSLGRYSGVRKVGNDMISFTRMGYHVGVALDTTILASVQV